jgi:hypothetical protein
MIMSLKTKKRGGFVNYLLPSPFQLDLEYYVENDWTISDTR